ncbi:DUF4870 domain-containing protein [Halorubellus salinus]|uniref:DUF4870 domain-containing protein n=1 Tax=Halorubellus salinus TaxID=755309 RepID=UPI001D08F1EF|nr:hypothetical protein [Halorubellus salinus]
MATEDINTDASTTEHSTETIQQSTGTGLDSNVAGALAYLFGALTGIIFYFLEPEDEFVRFHAAQSIVLSVSLFALSIGITFVSILVSIISSASIEAGFAGAIVSLVFFLAWLVIGLGTFALWLFLMLRAYQGKRTRVPIAAGIADRIA